MKRGKSCEEIVTDEWIQTEIINYMLDHYKLHDLRVFRWTKENHLREQFNDEIYKEIRKDLQSYTGSDLKAKRSEGKQQKCPKNSSTDCASSNASCTHLQLSIMQRRDSDSQLKPFADLLTEYEKQVK
jgi:hypothetical protein